MWGSHRAAIQGIDPWLISNSWAISLHVYFLSPLSRVATHSTILSVVADKVLPHRCLLLAVVRPLLNFQTHCLKDLSASRDSDQFFFKHIMNFYCPFTRSCSNHDICYLFIARHCERTVRHKVVVIDVTCRWRHKTLFCHAQTLLERILPGIDYNVAYVENKKNKNKKNNKL